MSPQNICLVPSMQQFVLRATYSQLKYVLISDREYIFQVVLVANSLPALNDVTAMELPDIVAEAAKVLFFPVHLNLVFSMFNLFVRVFKYHFYSLALLSKA